MTVTHAAYNWWDPQDTRVLGLRTLLRTRVIVEAHSALGGRVEVGQR
jgi:hypothetical protein